MRKFAKIENEETKVCSVGIGTNTEFYRSIGMSEMDVEQGFDGQYYLSGYAPEKPKSIINEERIAELQSFLDKTDWYAVRYAENGVEIPEKIRKERQAARDEISSLRGDDA